MLPLVMLVVAPIRSAADVPTVPVMTTLVPLDCTSAKYPAVPVLPAVPDVIAFAIAVTTPPDAAGVPPMVPPPVHRNHPAKVTGPDPPLLANLDRLDPPALHPAPERRRCHPKLAGGLSRTDVLAGNPRSGTHALASDPGTHGFFFTAGCQ